MSCTELIFFNKKGNISKIKNINNAHKSAYTIWKRLFNKYRKNEDFIREIIYNQGKNIWNLWKDFDLTDEELICLFYSFDYAIIEKSNIPRLLDAMRIFHRDDDSLLEQANIIEEMFLKHKSIRYLGCHQTDVSCEYWYNNNCLREEKSFFIFKDLLDKLQKS